MRILADKKHPSQDADSRWLATPEGRAAEAAYDALIDVERRAYLMRVAYRRPHPQAFARVTRPVRRTGRAPRRASKARVARVESGSDAPPRETRRSRDLAHAVAGGAL